MLPTQDEFGTVLYPPVATLLSLYLFRFHEHTVLGYVLVAIGCRPKAQVPAALCGLKSFDWLLVVCQLRWIYLSTPPININHNCFAQVEFRVTPCFKLMRGIEQDLPTCIVSCQSSNVVHEGDIVELLGLCNTMADTERLTRAPEMLQQGIDEDNKDAGR